MKKDETTGHLKKRMAEVIARTTREDLINQVRMGVDDRGFGDFAGGIYGDPVMSAWTEMKRTLIDTHKLPLAV